MENKKNQNRIYYFDVLRVVSVLAVISLHVCSIALENYGMETVEWNISNAYSSISRFAVPVFIMISGALFLDKDIPIKVLYKKYILRLIIAYVVYFVIYNLIDSLEHGRRFASIVKKLLSVSYVPYHLWFIIMMIGLYIIVPVLRMIVKDKRITKYYCVLSVLFAFLLPQVLSLLEAFGGDYYSVINNYYKDLCLYLPIGFTGYFVLGHFLANTTINRKGEIVIYILGVVGVILQFYYQQIHEFQELNGSTPLMDYLNVNLRFSVFLEAIAVFVFAKNHIKFKDTIAAKAVIGISKSSFGIYLVHLAFLNLLEKHIISLTPLGFNPIISDLLCTGIVFILSVLVALMLKRIPFVNRYIA